MTWHLKDRELEKKLIAIDPEFIDKLQRKEGYGNYGFYLDLGGYVCSGDCGVPKIQIYLVPEELEEVPEYNPHAWNEYPKVMPPEYVWMRLEICPGSPVASRVCAKFKNGKWFLDDGTVENFGDYPARFRPWSED